MTSLVRAVLLFFACFIWLFLGCFLVNACTATGVLGSEPSVVTPWVVPYLVPQFPKKNHTPFGSMYMENKQQQKGSRPIEVVNLNNCLLQKKKKKHVASPSLRPLGISALPAAALPMSREINMSREQPTEAKGSRTNPKLLCKF